MSGIFIGDNLGIELEVTIKLHLKSEYAALIVLQDWSRLA